MPYLGFDPLHLLFMLPALALAMFAQWRVQSAFAHGLQQPARFTGFQAARTILDANGLYQVPIEVTPGSLSDHYDPSHRVVRLSPEVYGTRSVAAVGVAAHEVGHALQHALGYAPLSIRNAAVPIANFGSGASMLLLMLGIFFQFGALVWLGVLAFAGVVFFQVVNLPVEFNASSRAKDQLVALGLVARHEIGDVSRVLNAAAMTYVAATLQSVLTLLYYLIRLTGSSRDE